MRILHKTDRDEINLPHLSEELQRRIRQAFIHSSGKLTTRTHATTVRSISTIEIPRHADGCSTNMKNQLLGPRLYAVSLGLLVLIVFFSGPALHAQNAQPLDPESPVAQFRQLRSEGIQAINQSQMTDAIAKLERALAIQPDSGAVLLLLTQIHMQTENVVRAQHYIAQYIARGYVLTETQYSKFKPLLTTELTDQNSVNAKPRGSMESIATIPGMKLVESFSIDPADGALTFSSIHSGVVETYPGGSLIAQFTDGEAPFGLAKREQTLWISTAITPHTSSFSPQSIASRSAIVAIDLENNGHIERYTLAQTVPHTLTKPPQPSTQRDNPPADQARENALRLGDLCLGRNTLFVSDAVSGSVLQLPNYHGNLQPLTKSNWFGSPQGIAENESATALLVADYSSGLHRIDINSKQHRHLLPPANAHLIGLDGIYRYKNDLIAIQNGANPARILRIQMDANWQSIDRVSVLLQDNEILHEPTTGVVVDDLFYFIAHSQWGDFDENGKPKSEAPAATVIGRIRLDD